MYIKSSTKGKDNIPHSTKQYPIGYNGGDEEIGTTMVKCFKESTNVSGCKISIKPEKHTVFETNYSRKKWFRSLHTEQVFQGSQDDTTLVWTLEQIILHLFMFNSLNKYQ